MYEREIAEFLFGLVCAVGERHIRYERPVVFERRVGVGFVAEPVGDFGAAGVVEVDDADERLEGSGCHRGRILGGGSEV